MNENYQDSNLCLAYVASKFNLSERYISNVIKDTTGKSYIDYIESTRINTAVDLLNDTDMTISEIAKEVGYEYDNTFYKAFKRCLGCSPGQYRVTYNS